MPLTISYKDQKKGIVKLTVVNASIYELFYLILSKRTVQRIGT